MLNRLSYRQAGVGQDKFGRMLPWLRLCYGKVYVYYVVRSWECLPGKRSSGRNITMVAVSTVSIIILVKVV
jgi:hypothetical protein